MKNIVFLYFFCLSTTFVMAQSYHSLLESGKNGDTYFWVSECFANPCYGYREVVQGDTIIDNILYQKVFSYAIVSINPPDAPVLDPPFTLASDKNLIGFMREDTIDKKVYSRIPEDSYSFDRGEEYLVYDFSLQVGDSLVLGYLDSIVFVLDTIETVTLLNGESRNKYIFNDRSYAFSYSIFYIEGIGGISGFFFPFFTSISVNSNLSCVRNDSNNLYEDDSTYGCAIITNTKDIDVLPISIFPNPVSDILQINTDMGNIGVEIFDLYGRLVYQEKLNSVSSQIDIEHIPNGVYFISIYSYKDKNQVQIFRILKR